MGIVRWQNYANEMNNKQKKDMDMRPTDHLQRRVDMNARGGDS